MQVPIINVEGAQVGLADLRVDIFNIEPNRAVMHQALLRQLANARLGTVKTKTRGNTSGSGKKLWKQKGTGRARVASLRSPLWKGGGNVHGPQPRDWTSEMPRKMKRGALKSALSERLREGNLVVVDAFDLDDHKTKTFVSIVENFGWDKKTLIIETNPNNNLVLSSRNLPGFKVASGANVNIYDVLNHEKLVFTKEAINALQAKLSN
jgi:large subunit ribosomal protein L4